MIIQREVEQVMLAIDELVKARIAGDDMGANAARVKIVDNLKTVIRTATGERAS